MNPADRTTPAHCTQTYMKKYINNMAALTSITNRAIIILEATSSQYLLEIGLNGKQ
jgi:hypothetical protein